jgi:hypothetical protein
MVRLKGIKMPVKPSAGHYQVKNLPPGIKECWFYTGKQSSIHIVLNHIDYEILINGYKHKIKLSVPQINMNLPSIRKFKED